MLALCLAALVMQLPNAVATFEGVFKTANSKVVEVQVENGETLRMLRTRGTRFVRNGKPARPADFHDGEPVTVDAERDVRLNLLVVKVELAKSSGGEAK